VSTHLFRRSMANRAAFWRIALAGTALIASTICSDKAARSQATDGITMPQVIGLSAASASKQLRTLQLVPQIEIGRPSSDARRLFEVYEQSPTQGSRVTPGTEVVLRIHGPETSPAADMSVESETRLGTSDVTDHFEDAMRRLVAIDLNHGQGMSRIVLRRIWQGDDTFNEHFGRGWSDPNNIQVTQLGDERVILLRGGVGWQTGYRDGDGFALPGNHRLAKGGNGWRLTGPHGDTMTFDTTGRLDRVENRFGQAMNVEYNPQGLMRRLELNTGNFLSYHYGSHGHVERVEGPEGLTARYEYDEQGRLSAATSARGFRFEYRYDEDGNLEAAVDSRGNKWTPDSTKALSPPTGVPPATDPEATASIPQIDKPECEFNDQRLVSAVSVGGQKTTYRYGCCGRVEEIRSSQGTTRLRYDNYGRVIEIEEPDGSETKFTYHPLGLPKRIASNDGRWASCAYDDHGQMIEKADSSGVWQRWTYDPHGRAVEYHASPDYYESYTYDARDRIVAVRFSTGNSVNYRYDEAGNVVEATWASGESTRWKYDASGRCVEAHGPLGLVTRFGRDDQGGIWQDDAIYGRRMVRLGEGGRRTVVTWQDVGTASVRTDRRLRPLERVLRSGASVQFSYDSQNNLSSVLDASGQAWRYQHDAAKRLRSIQSPNGSATSLEYDRAGRLAAIHRDEIPWRQYVNDRHGRLSVASSPAGPASVYQYDSVGRIRSMTIPDGQVQFRYDDQGQITEIDGPHWQLQQEYHADGQLSQLAYQPAGMEFEFPLDRLGRRAGVRLNDLLVRYCYDGRGQLERIELPDGSSIQLTVDPGGRVTEIGLGQAATMRMTYDRFDRMLSLNAQNSSGLPLLAEQHAFDVDGNLQRTESGSGDVARYEYDSNHRLTRVTKANVVQQFAYTADGNLRTPIDNAEVPQWQLDRAGRPTREGTQRFFQWNASGNLTRVQAVDAQVHYEFDAADQLVRSRREQNDTVYGYLPDGDRIWRRDNQGTTWYAYGTEGLLGLKDPDDVAWLVVTLPGSDWPLALCGSDGSVRMLVADRMRSIRRTLNAAGVVISESDYGPWGRLTRQVGRSPLESFAGMVRDGNLYYARARYYDPTIGRFLSIDPEVGTLGIPASHNAYAYAGNNPLRYRDPRGASAFNQIGVSSHIDDQHHKLMKLGLDVIKMEYDPATRGPKVAPPKAPPSPASTPPVRRPPAPTPWTSSSNPGADVAPLRPGLKTPGVDASPISPTPGPAPPSSLPPRAARPVAGPDNIISFSDTPSSPTPSGPTGVRPGNTISYYDALGDSSTSRPSATLSRTGAAAPRPKGPIVGKPRPRFEFWPSDFDEKIKILDRLDKINTALSVLTSMADGDIEGAVIASVKGFGGEMIELAFFPTAPGVGTAIINTSEMAYEGIQLGLANTEVQTNREQTSEMIKEVIPQRLIKILDRPGSEGRFIPFAGQPLPPATLTDPIAQQRRFEELIRRLRILMDIIRNNIINGQNPTDGVFIPSEDRENPGNPARDLYEDRLAEARELVRRGRELSEIVRTGRVAVEKMELGAGRTLREITARLEDLGPLRETLDALLEGIADLKKLTKAGREGKPTSPADWDAVVKLAEANATTVCGYVDSDASSGLFGPSSQLAEHVDWKKRANDLIRETSLAIDAAEKQGIDEGHVDPPSKDELRAAINKVKTLSEKLAGELESLEDVNASLAAAQQVIDNARARREIINAQLNELNKLDVGPRVNEILAPYASEAAFQLMIAADEIEAGLGPIRKAVAMMNRATLDSLLDEAEDAKKRIDNLVGEANPAMSDAEAAIEAAQELLEGKHDNPEHSEGDDGPTRAYRALKRALECYSKIKPSRKAVDPSQPASEELSGTVGGIESDTMMRRSSESARSLPRRPSDHDATQEDSRPATPPQQLTAPRMTPGHALAAPGHHPDADSKPAEQGFRDGDGALVDGRFATAVVTNGNLTMDQAVTAVSGGLRKPNSGDRTAIEFWPPGDHPITENHVTWHIKRFQSAADAQSVIEKFTQWGKGEDNNLGKLENAVIKSRYASNDSLMYISVDDSRPQIAFEIVTTVYQRAVIYRDRFVIAYHCSRGEYKADLHATGEAVVAKSKQLIDLRFPNRKSQVDSEPTTKEDSRPATPPQQPTAPRMTPGHALAAPGHHPDADSKPAEQGFQDGDGGLVGPDFAGAKVSDGDSCPYEDPNGQWKGGSAGPNTVLHFEKRATYSGEAPSYRLLIRKCASTMVAKRMLELCRNAHKELNLPDEHHIRRSTTREDSRTEFGSIHEYSYHNPADPPTYQHTIRSLATVYREKFFIALIRGEPTLTTALDSQVPALIEKCKQLIDLRFPEQKPRKDSEPTGRFLPSDGAQIAACFADSRVSDGAASPYPNDQASWSGASAGPGTLLYYIPTVPRLTNELEVKVREYTENAKRLIDRRFPDP
jgi:RHS repeat-associated protein